MQGVAGARLLRVAVLLGDHLGGGWAWAGRRAKCGMRWAQLASGTCPWARARLGF